MTTDPARPFGRVLTAMVTPFTEDGSLDLAGAQELAAHLVDRCSHDGLVIAGTTGEAPTLSDAEQRTLLEAVLDAVGDRATVVAGVGTNDTAHSIERARDAERLGVHGLLVVTPYYNKPPQAGLLRHFTSVADSTDLPVMLYDIPPRSVVPIEVETLVRAAEHPKIVAVKDADLARARAVNESLLPVYTGIFRTQGVILTKAALRELGLPAGPVRPPLVDATPEQIAQLRTDLADGGIHL